MDDMTVGAYSAAVLQEDRVEVLHRVLEDCVHELGASAAALLVQNAGRLEMLGATAHSAQHVEVWQLLHDRGPCADAIRDGVAVLAPDPVAVRTRWPAFSRPLADAGFAGLAALPMRWRGTTYGGLNVVSDVPGRLTRDRAVVAQRYADLASLVVLAARGVPADVLPLQLLPLLTDQIDIERAKGVLSATEGIPVSAAFDRLHELARERGSALTETAHQVQRDAVARPRVGGRDAAPDAD